MDESVLRRSLRRINPFRSKLFRLPATPRLSRSTKVGAGERETEWNFERAVSMRTRPLSKNLQNSTDSLSLPNNSVHSSPPDSREAQNHIHAHMESLRLGHMPSAAASVASYSRIGTYESRKINNIHENGNRWEYNQLPHTKYSRDGTVCNATWSRDSALDDSPNQSTISLLSHRKQQSCGTMLWRTGSLRPTYPLNGISRPPSTEPTTRRNIQPSVLPLYPLFELDQFYSTQDLEETFIGREWVFREIYQSSIVEKVPVTIIEGSRGAGKSTIANQLILNSPFYSAQASDTMDSGCVPDQVPIDSRNYEWLRAVSARIVAYHVCSMHSASSCAVPEFVCNLAAMLARSAVLKSYTDILSKNHKLLELLRLEECVKYAPIEVFQKTIAGPLSQLKSSDEGCLLILIDGIDEAEFHRSEDGSSIGTFIRQISSMLPSWIRFILTCDEDSTSLLEEIPQRRIRIDDFILDERVVRDNRMLLEYRISMIDESAIESQDLLLSFADRVLANAGGNMLYIRMLLKLIETGRVAMTVAERQTPTHLSHLYTLFMDATFTSPGAWHRVCPVLNVLLASLRPLSREVLIELLNATPQDKTSQAELNEALTILTPLLTFTSDGGISFHHCYFRDWLVKNPSNGKYQADARNGHILHALHLSKLAPLESEDIFELAHHLLKAHPYKYMNGEYVPELTSSKEGQLVWLRKSSSDISHALCNHRNFHFPNTKVTKLLIMASASCTAILDGQTLAQWAASAGHWPLLNTFLHHGASIEQPSGKPLLSLAARNGHFDCVHMLYPMDGGENLREATIEAAKGGYVQIISYLLGVKWPSEEDRRNCIREANIEAAGQGHTGVCQYLVDSFDFADVSEAMTAACEGGHADTVQFLLSRGASLSSVKWPSDKSALHCAVESGSWDLVVAVLNLESNQVFALDSLKRTPLIIAAKCGHVGLIDMLLNKGSNIDHQDKRGWTALMHAVHAGHLSCVQVLVDRDANMNCKDESGRTVAHIACTIAAKPIIERLIEAGVLIEDRDAVGQRPIESAIRAKNRQALESLLRRGARLRSTTWQVALDYDVESLFMLITKLIDDAGILYRKKRLDDSMQRLHYALDKIAMCLDDPKLNGQRSRLMVQKTRVLVAGARVRRREGVIEKAILMCDEAASCAQEEALFEILLLRAKCHFDAQNVDRARADALAASRLRPLDEEACHLLNILQTPPTNISRL